VRAAALGLAELKRDVGREGEGRGYGAADLLPPVRDTKLGGFMRCSPTNMPWDTEYAPYGTMRDYAKHLRDQGQSWDAVARQITEATGNYVVGDSIRKSVMRASRALVTTPNSVTPVFEDKVHADTDWRSLLVRAKAIGEQKEKSVYWQDRAYVSLATDKPIMVTHSADWHFGSLATDIDMLEGWIEKVLTTDGLYVISCGDELEQRGQFKSVKPTLWQSLDPHEQKWFFENLWRELVDAGKLICCTWGNHTESQHEKVFGFSPIEDIKAKDIPYFRGAGHLTLKVGAVEYTYTLNHQNRYNSSFNATHSSRQTARVGRDVVDVMVDAHTHNPEMAQGMDDHGRWIAVKCGTFKTDDDFSQRHFKQGYFAAPCIVFHPDKKQMSAFWSIGDAECYIAGQGG